jgi:hypothetical protein
VTGNHTPHRAAKEHSSGYELGREVGRQRVLSDTRAFILDAKFLYGDQSSEVSVLRALDDYLRRNA